MKLKINLQHIILLLLLLIIPVSVFAEESSASEFAELDTAADAAHVLRMALGMEQVKASEISFSDVTANQSITRADSLAILMRSTDRLHTYSDLTGAVEDTLLGEAYLDKFSYTGTIQTANGYRSDKVAIEISSFQYGDSVCYLADIYVRDISCLRSAFSHGEYGEYAESAVQMCSDNGGIVALSGDMYLRNANDSFVRNGIWYEKAISTSAKDVGVLYADGRFATYPSTVTEEELKASGDIWQLWRFGPMLLDENGEPKTEFNSILVDENPRAAFGYYSPGHYCFLVVDGRQKGYSEGITLRDLSKLVHTLGCKTAYNLDGGASAIMATGKKNINKPCSGGRMILDIVYIAEPLA